MTSTSQPDLEGAPDMLTRAAAARPGDDPIFALHGEATRRAAAGEDILNATLGALVDDQGALCVMPTVFGAFQGVDPTRAAAYAPIAGDAEFLEAVTADALGGRAGLVSKAVSVATAGGTGALHHAVVNFLEPGQALLTTDFFWGPYRTIAEHTGREVETFPMFNSERRFDTEAFEAALGRQLDAQGRALVILNSPCHNPTGYSLDAFEWRCVVETLNRAAKRGPVALCVDLAYARYGAEGSDAWLEAVEGLAPEVPLLVAWSASKSYAQYGARVGSLIAVVGEPEARRRVKAALLHSCRGTWSNCNHLGLLAITSLLADPEARAAADRDRAKLVRLLNERVAAFNALARPAGLDFPRYEGGFFVTVFTPHAARVAELCREDGVYLVPLKGGVRVALCATPQGQVERLVKTLASALERAS
jgi:aromatic-amino-acid transaminase